MLLSPPRSRRPGSTGRALQEQTGYPVRAEWRRPGDPEPHPPADALLVAPVTFNTVNEWAVGRVDTLALGILNEAIGTGLPVHAFPGEGDSRRPPRLRRAPPVARGSRGRLPRRQLPPARRRDDGRPLGNSGRHPKSNRPADRYDISVGVLDMRATYTAPARSGLNGYARLRTQPPAIGEVAGDICELPTLWRVPARDNDSGRCAPCQAATDRLSAPPAVPVSFWDHEPLGQALADRRLGRVMRAYRFHPYHGRLALSQTVVAGWLGMQAQLSRVENGPPVVDLDRLAHWATILGIRVSCLFSLPDARPGFDHGFGDSTGGVGARLP